MVDGGSGRPEPAPRLVPVPEPWPVELPPPERVPLGLPLELGGIEVGQGRRVIPPHPDLMLPALAVIGKAATRTTATARVPSTFFMTFSFFKTVLVSFRFRFVLSDLPMEIATGVPVLRRAPSVAPFSSRDARRAAICIALQSFAPVDCAG